MKDYLASIEKLRADAAEAALIRDMASDPVKRDMYNRIHDHLMRLAGEVQLALSKVGTTANLSAGNPEPITSEHDTQRP